MIQPPEAARHAHALVAHDEVRTDDWYWLHDRDNPEVVAYLEAENEYADAVLAPTLPLQAQLFSEIRSRVRETDVGAPVYLHGWWYYTRTFEGLQYPVHCRRPDPERALDTSTVLSDARGENAGSGGEKVVLDENLLAGESDFLALGVFDTSPDESVLAYGVDLDGSEVYTLRFRDLTSGVDLADVIPGVYYGSAWAKDCQTLFYVRPDQSMRPWQVWRHVVGEDRERDQLVFQEDDEHFFVDVGLTRSERRVVIHSASKTTSEWHWIDPDAPRSSPQMLLAREPGVEYEVDDDEDGWLVWTNRAAFDGKPAPNFALYRLAREARRADELEVIIPPRDDVRIESAEAFAGFIVVVERWEDDALERLRVLGRDGSDRYVPQPEPVYGITSEANPEWASPVYRFGYTSLVTPRSAMEYNPATGEVATVWSQPVLGDYDKSSYTTERIWATAADGAKIPISLVARKDVIARGPAPCLLYGYGSYEISIDPTFSSMRLNLLDRGACFAIAHIRGGGEKGRAWYEQGKMDHKANTFGDFIAAASHLVESGWVDAGKLAARGGSAGGLLMGAVTNMRPDLWRVVIAEVPFVDVVTTMSDESLPLTVTEWEEWGDPVHDGEAFKRMMEYSPYDNVAPGEHPAIYATGGLNDPLVGFWEPAKWVAKLRSVGAGSSDRPIILRTELGAGHQGPSGRYDAWRDESRVQAFLLTQWGLA